MKMDDFQYQDIRIYGETVSKGMRECESRYEAIKPFLERYNKKDPIKILDFGANYGYFTWRIKEDYPNAEITMVDGRQLLNLIYKINNLEGISLINRNMQLEEIRNFGKENHFDLILVMSILHHFSNPEETLDAFIDMADTIICEIDYPDHPNFTNLQERVHNHLMTKNPIQINNWISHDRPIYYLNKNEIGIPGRVISGGGLAQINIPYLYKILDWINIKLFPGTLNIWMTSGIDFDPLLKVSVYSLVRVYINGFPVLALKDTNLELSPNFAELVSTECLRKKFNLKDDDIVYISFEKHNVRVIE